MQSRTEPTIIQQLKAGHREAFESIFHDLYPTLLLYAKKILGATDAAEDPVQEAFVEVWKHRSKFESHVQIRAFLYMTVRNKCLNQLKHHTIVREHGSASETEEYDSYREETLRSELIYQLRSAIRKLPEQRKKIMLLSLKGLKNQEIAEFLDISVNTVKQQKKIAYASLKDSLGKHALLLAGILFFSS